jgi:hypothetical protein
VGDRRATQHPAWPWRWPFVIAHAFAWCWGALDDRWCNYSKDQQTALSNWFWYSVILGSVPIWFTLGLKFIANTDPHPLRYGDFYLLGALLAFSGVGAMFSSKSRGNIGNAALIVGIIDAGLYAGVASSTHPHNIAVNVTSVVLYIGSALLSLGCVLASASGGD